MNEYKEWLADWYKIHEGEHPSTVDAYGAGRESMQSAASERENTIDRKSTRLNSSHHG
jgi:hypothetical protein